MGRKDELPAPADNYQLVRVQWVDATAYDEDIPENRISKLFLQTFVTYGLLLRKSDIDIIVASTFSIDHTGGQLFRDTLLIPASSVKRIDILEQEAKNPMESNKSVSKEG